ncbi:MAG: phospholipase D-like domain-containing protein [Candidatus Thermoplasmatota archaeon]
MTKSLLAGCIWIIIIAGYASNTIKAELADTVPSSVVITEIYYDTYLPYEPEEYIKIHNPTENDVDISCWELTDLEARFIFPNSAILKSKNSIYVTKNTTAFYEEFGFLPDFQLDDNKFQLANSGDEVILKDSQGNTVDVVIYGNSTYVGEGWKGKPAEKVSEGAILKRKISEISNLYIDTDIAFDWNSPRIYRVGQSTFEYKTFQLNTTLIAFVSPDNSFQAIKKELESAKESIYLSLYQLTSVQLAEYLLNASERDVEIKILLEGSPVGWNLTNVDEQEYCENINAYKEAYTEKYILSKLFEKGGDVRFIVSSKQRPARYNYLHSKYAIIDNETVIISSENWKPTGIPTSAYGDRGWGVVIKSAELAKYLGAVFSEDFNLSKKDIIMMSLNNEKYSPPPNWFVPTDENISCQSSYKPKFKAKIVNSLFNISVVLSPDTSLLETSSILGLINSAKKYIYIELLSCKPNWSAYPNLYLEAAIDAARRGCEVKILLDGKYVSEETNTQDNLDTVAYVREIARKENLNLEAKALVFEKDYLAKIHNKGMVVDGEKVLISSINWNYNSVANNREAGVIIENSDVAKYFEDVFMLDWRMDGNAYNDNESDHNEKILISPFHSTAIILIAAITLSVIRDLRK